MADELNTLQNQDEWDFDGAERRPGVKNTRAVVSVAFARDDFERVSECAERVNKKTSEFIREAALEKVRQRQMPTVMVAFSGSVGASMFTHRPFPSTRGSASTPRGASRTGAA